jgi:hypothetical protein
MVKPLDHASLDRVLARVASGHARPSGRSASSRRQPESDDSRGHDA